MPGPARYQTRAQRLNRLEVLAEAERMKLQATFRQESQRAVQDLGRAQGLHDR